MPIEPLSDIVTQETVNLKVPDCEEIHITVPATPEQVEEVKKLGIRGERVRAGTAEGNDNLLAITGDGMKVALDPKLMHPELEPMEGGKCEACAREVFRIWEETADMRGAQLVFCDRSTPASGKWNIQDDMRRRLIEAGIPSEQVACVSDVGNDPEKKETLFEKVRTGEVRVLMGSTDPTTAPAGTIRGDLGRAWNSPHMENLIHGSDSVDNATREISLWFPEIY